jgi:hypothetical protein
MSKVVQCQLRTADVWEKDESRYVMVTWLEADRGLKPGDAVKLKDFRPDHWWEVISVSIPHERSDIKRG